MAEQAPSWQYTDVEKLCSLALNGTNTAHCNGKITKIRDINT